MKDWKPILDTVNDKLIDNYRHALDKYIDDNPMLLIDLVARSHIPMKIYRRYRNSNFYFDKQLTEGLFDSDIIRKHQDLLGEEVMSFYFHVEYIAVYLKDEIKTDDEIKIIAGETAVGRFAKWSDK